MVYHGIENTLNIDDFCSLHIIYALLLQFIIFLFLNVEHEENVVIAAIADSS